jgi:hypothetical protein
MAANKPKIGREEILLAMKRAGIKGGPGWEETLEKAYGEIKDAARKVRVGIERNDEPASAFRLPVEKRR